MWRGLQKTSGYGGNVAPGNPQRDRNRSLCLPGKTHPDNCRRPELDLLLKVHGAHCMNPKRKELPGIASVHIRL
ncbi:hypothetical protein M404DRAFT_496871 [Pisolithus tinctorius Marx 270]|uniref:Uncharacterized protein n=1 Tax=Pisolithus tinctorius Marx 270 TaxID=870435 RepID=A0A0C3PEA9_PISTI|nr:hypothetical protein M404DRAFT_496871 [Pisolithus tinctorius Marx 270]